MASRSIDGGGALLAAGGLACALGLDLPTACAAARAQISRATVQRHFRQRSGADGMPEDVVGHSADLLTLGFERDARLLRLAQAALADLQARAPDATWWQRRVSFHLALAEPERHLAGDPPSDEPAQAPDDDEPPPPTAEAQGHALLRRCLLGARWPAAPVAATVHAQGHVAGLEAMAAACQALQSGQADVAVVLGCDTLLDEDSLGWLARRGRLKCDAAPTGLQPGEAAVALALLPQGAAGAAAGLRVERLVFGDEPKCRLAGGVSTGEVLSAALATGAEGAPLQRVWLFSDHNGEFHRANELGGALARLREWGSAFAEPELWYPALAFGDTGACASLLALAQALHALQRGRAPAATALLAACADGPARAAARLSLV